MKPLTSRVTYYSQLRQTPGPFLPCVSGFLLVSQSLGILRQWYIRMTVIVNLDLYCCWEKNLSVLVFESFLELRTPASAVFLEGQNFCKLRSL